MDNFKEDLGKEDFNRGKDNRGRDDTNIEPLIIVTQVLEPVEHSTTWCSSSLFAAKPSKPGNAPHCRLVSDFWVLNQYLKRPGYPLDGFSQLLKHLNPKHRYFSTMDFFLVINK